MLYINYNHEKKIGMIKIKRVQYNFLAIPIIYNPFNIQIVQIDLQ